MAVSTPQIQLPLPWLLTGLLITAAQGMLPVTANATPEAQINASEAVPVPNVGLQQGDSGPAVEALQRALGRNGLFPHAVTGLYGPHTIEAVKTFQRIQELPATGIADDRTLSAIGLDPSQLGIVPVLSHPVVGNLTTDTLAEGDQGDNVKKLQQVLDSYGLEVTVDGLYRASTQQAIRTFQRVRGLMVDGVATRETLLAMGFEPYQVPAEPPVTATAAASNPSSINADSLIPGDSGPGVSLLQRRLRNDGYNLMVTGTYDDLTEAAVRAYQQSTRLPATGTADRATLEALGFEIPDYRYVTAIITDPNNLPQVKQSFPNAELEDRQGGEYIRIGRFSDRAAAEGRASRARQQGFDARVIFD